MKAINNKGTITIYQSVPNTLQTPTGTIMNAPALSEEKLKEYGLFDLVLPNDYNPSIHDLGEIYWDTENSVFKKDIINKTWQKSIEEYKLQAIDNFNSKVGHELAKSNWYIIREMENGTEVPSEITSKRQTLRDTANATEIEINELVTIEEIITFDYPNID